MDFYSALIQSGVCRGAVFYNEATGQPEVITADSVVISTGGQNALFGKTTGSTQCDGYAAGKLFTQGVALKNLEFIQYHPTTIETGQKRMLISEAVRGEGGRLYYEDEQSGSRVYFMEKKFGQRGNLMPRDIVSRCMEETGKMNIYQRSIIASHVVPAAFREYLTTLLIGKDILTIASLLFVPKWNTHLKSSKEHLVSARFVIVE